MIRAAGAHCMPRGHNPTVDIPWIGENISLRLERRWTLRATPGLVFCRPVRSLRNFPVQRGPGKTGMAPRKFQ
jgi:hypothetical protein